MNQQALNIRFWGVRGTIPTPGKGTVRYGGNTACVSVQIGDDRTLILDAGTGIRELGKRLVENDSQIILLTSHQHWDHIQGFPSFLPIYQPGRDIYVLHALGETSVRSLIVQMDGIFFPVKMDDLLSNCIFVDEDVCEFLSQDGVLADRIALNHPGGGYGYRIASGDRSLVYLTDNELFPPGQTTTELAAFVEFCSGTDVLIHDTQYLAPDMPDKLGWGHSILQQVLDLAAAAEVKHLILFHHDPDRTDAEIDIMQEHARNWLARNAPQIRCTAAFEGLEIRLD